MRFAQSTKKKKTILRKINNLLLTKSLFWLGWNICCFIKGKLHRIILNCFGLRTPRCADNYFCSTSGFGPAGLPGIMFAVLRTSGLVASELQFEVLDRYGEYFETGIVRRMTEFLQKLASEFPPSQPPIPPTFPQKFLSKYILVPLMEQNNFYLSLFPLTFEAR